MGSEDVQEPDVQEPMGASTLLDLLRSAEERGFSVQFVVAGDGRVRCGACRSRHRVERFAVHRHERLEGASDAADMLLVVWARCPGCGARGVLTLGYGPNASEVDAVALERLRLEQVDE